MDFEMGGPGLSGESEEAYYEQQKIAKQGPARPPGFLVKCYRGPGISPAHFWRYDRLEVKPEPGLALEIQGKPYRVLEAVPETKTPYIRILVEAI